MKLLALDWGLATGMAMYDTENQEHSAWTCDSQTAISYLRGFVSPYGTHPLGKKLVLCEDFIISQRTTKIGVPKNWRRGRELELIGVTKYICSEFSQPVEMQTPEKALGFATDAKLKAMGWWTPGPDHSRDASRHVLVYCVEHKLVDAAVLLPTAA